MQASLLSYRHKGTAMQPDLARQLRLPPVSRLFHYDPHAHDSYEQTYVTPGTVDPEIPSHIHAGDDTPDVHKQEQEIQERARFAALLDFIFETVHKPGYEMYGPITLGGKSQASQAQIANTTGVGSVYSVTNPFDTDAEYCCICANFGAAGQAVLSKDPSNLAPALSSFYDGNTLTRVLPFFASGVAAFTYGSDYWFPIPASDSLYWAVSMTTPNTNSALATVAFRRRINRFGKYYLTQE